MEQFDIEDGVWTKPGSTTKQKTEHRVPLSAPARQLLAELHADNHTGLDDASYVFPGRRWAPQNHPQGMGGSVRVDRA